jgi:hypothetical protein
MTTARSLKKDIQGVIKEGGPKELVIYAENEKARSRD